MALNDVTYNYRVTSLTTGFTTIYAVPASQHVLNLSLFLANTTNSNQRYDTAAVPSGASLSAAHYLRPVRAASGTHLAPGDSETIEARQNFPAGTSIQGRCDTAGVMATHLSVSLREVT